MAKRLSDTDLLKQETKAARILPRTQDRLHVLTMPKQDDRPSVVYALQSSNHSYVGCTNDFARRLRQHNGLIKGGARYTRQSSVWKPVFVVSGFPQRRHALQFEKQFHRSFGRRTVTVPRVNPFGSSAGARRAWYLYQVLKKERFSQQDTVPTSELVLRIEWSIAKLHRRATRLCDWGPARVTHVLVV